MERPNKLEYILMVAIIVCPSFLIAGWYLINQANQGNMIALAILIVIAVLLIGLFSNLSTLIAIFANQRQDNQVLNNSRQAQENALLAAKMLTQMQRAETERQRQATSRAPQIVSVEAPQLYLESGTEFIEGLVDE